MSFSLWLGVRSQPCCSQGNTTHGSRLSVPFFAAMHDLEHLKHTQ